MEKLEVFLDYTCPYCLKGYELLTKLLPDYVSDDVGADTLIQLRPVEAHPKNEEPEHRPYVNLAVQGAFFFRDNGLDETAYTERMFKVANDDRQSVESISALAAYAAEYGADADAFTAALTCGRYELEQLAANDYAYEQKSVWAVPTFVCGEKRLDAVGGVGVTGEQLKKLLDECFSPGT
jgi:predicted DsbA family dithiol-disulfide isomerase